MNEKLEILWQSLEAGSAKVKVKYSMLNPSLETTNTS